MRVFIYADGNNEFSGRIIVVETGVSYRIECNSNDGSTFLSVLGPDSPETTDYEPGYLLRDFEAVRMWENLSFISGIDRDASALLDRIKRRRTEVRFKRPKTSKTSSPRSGRE
jgi:hypothetical protein